MLHFRYEFSGWTQNKHGRAYYSLLPPILFGGSPRVFQADLLRSADEILTHRVIWSFFFMVALLSVSRQWRQVKRLLKTPKKIFLLALSAVLVGGNWLLFIWAVNNHHMLEASPGLFH
ncbi:chloramphenicol-sensitive protein RarD [Salmonella enterica subsp. enterica]|uniref:Chloramphenicol-sensitive protein RarD n=1 Tax=Salmonella enterica I TaxID=59201 RepID=A0A3S4GUW0_SALET|nr:chloramphenicol-sensitive protein RarD [Salmonella enterica subsp. enterica]